MDSEERRKALGEFLRTRRARLSPEEVGLPRGSRTPGLEREEVAQLANSSVTTPRSHTSTERAAGRPGRQGTTKSYLLPSPPGSRRRRSRRRALRWPPTPSALPGFPYTESGCRLYVCQRE